MENLKEDKRRANRQWREVLKETLCGNVNIENIYIAMCSLNEIDKKILKYEQYDLLG